MRCAYFVVLVHVVNIEKFRYLNFIVNDLMGQADFSKPLVTGHRSYLSWCLCALASCLARKVDVAKKACVWQQIWVSRWRLPNSCLCVGSPGICTKIMAFSVICRVTVMLV
jgi:hypothetical protein